MIEETGRVVAVEADGVWVAGQKASGCSKCATGGGCGQGLFAKFTKTRHTFVRFSDEQKVQVGDDIVIGISEDALMKSSLLVYGLPLGLFMLATVLAGGLFQLAEPWVVAAAFGGLALGFMLVRFYGHLMQDNPSYQPVLLRLVSREPELGEWAPAK